jgi:hypothetical protein
MMTGEKERGTMDKRNNGGGDISCFVDSMKRISDDFRTEKFVK